MTTRCWPRGGGYICSSRVYEHIWPRGAGRGVYMLKSCIRALYTVQNMYNDFKTLQRFFLPLNSFYMLCSIYMLFYLQVAIVDLSWLVGAPLYSRSHWLLDLALGDIFGRSQMDYNVFVIFTYIPNSWMKTITIYHSAFLEFILTRYIKISITLSQACLFIFQTWTGIL